MLKVLVWQVSNNTSFKDKAIKILEQQHNGIEIVGEAVNENIAKIDGGGQYDVLLVVGARGKMNDIVKDAIQLNLPEDKLLGDWIVTIPGFTLEKYRQLQRSRLSVFAQNCFGNMILNLLGLPFLSPLGHAGFSSRDFIRFLGAPRDYMKETPTFREQKIYANGKKHNFANLGDIVVSAFHYENFENFIEMWERRKPRINWDNILIEMYLNNEDREALRQFDALPYEKKVCFVPFKSDLPSAFYIPTEVRKAKAREWNNSNVLELREFVNVSVIKMDLCYDPFDMLLYGKKTPLIDMDYNESYLIPNPFY